MRILDWLRIVAVFLLVPGLFATVAPGFLQEAQAQTVSSVYVDPVTICCDGPGSIVTVNVRMNLAAGESINGFSVRLNYTGWETYPEKPPVLDALGIDHSNNVFAGGTVQVSAKCADGAALDSDGFCPTDDWPGGGQVHLAQDLIGTTISGPLDNQLLFAITFSVNNTGTSLFVLDRANLRNPGVLPFPIPRIVQTVTKAGVFGNTGLVAFFDFESPVGPSILPGHVVTFDASASFRAGTSSIPLTDATYSWNFSDGTSLGTGQVVSHSFSQPGRYRLQLNVTDQGDTETLERTVVVLPALGGLEVKVRNQRGSEFRWNVRVLVLNLTLSDKPVFNKTIDGAGLVSFDGLSPGHYMLRFLGPTLEEGEESRQMQVIAGWTSQETVYLKEIEVPGRGFAAELVFIGTILGGLGAAGTAVVWQRRSQKKGRLGKGRSARTVGKRGRANVRR